MELRNLLSLQRWRNPVSQETQQRWKEQPNKAPMSPQRFNQAYNLTMGATGGRSRALNPKLIAKGSKLYQKEINAYQRHLANQAMQAQLRKKFEEGIKNVPVFLRNKRLY